MRIYSAFIQLRFGTFDVNPLFILSFSIMSFFSTRTDPSKHFKAIKTFISKSNLVGYPFIDIKVLFIQL